MLKIFILVKSFFSLCTHLLKLKSDPIVYIKKKNPWFVQKKKITDGQKIFKKEF